MADTLRFQPDDITLGDMEDFEEMTGRPFMETLAAVESGDGMKAMRIKDLTALAFIVKRSENPDFTVADARKLKIGELVLDFEPVDPTEAASSNGGPPSATSGE